MSLSDKTKELLDNFADQQVALNDRDKPRGQSEIKLGTLLDEAHGALRSIKALYTPAKDGGTNGETYILDAPTVPAGAILTRAWTAANADTTDLTSELAITVGGSTIQAATAGSVLNSSVTVSALGGSPEATTGGKIKVSVSTADMTDGQFMVVLEYIYPVS